jgi:hypothetical protein
MSPEEAEPGTVVDCNYTHKDGTSSFHRLVVYGMDVGARSKTGKVMFWAFCLDHQRIEQRIPENINSLELADNQGDLGDTPIPPNPFDSDTPDDV